MELQKRILEYYKFIRLNFIHIEEIVSLEDIPLSLQTELYLQLYAPMIEQSNFFQLADPTFILSIVRKLRQQLATPEDKICREGEDAQ